MTISAQNEAWGSARRWDRHIGHMGHRRLLVGASGRGNGVVSVQAQRPEVVKPGTVHGRVVVEVGGRY